YLHVQAKDSLGNEGAVKTVYATLDNTGPVINGLSDDDVHKQSKTWDWSTSSDGTGVGGVTYRYEVETTGTSGGNWSSYDSTTTATQGSGTGTYYLHVQAKDSLGNEGAVKTVYATLDNTAPTFLSNTLTAGYIDITMSQGVYATSGGFGALVTSDFSVTCSTSGLNLSSLTDTSDQALTGGEEVIRLVFNKNMASGDTITVTPASGDCIYDSAGNSMADTQTSEEQTYTASIRGTSFYTLTPRTLSSNDDDTLSSSNHWWGAYTSSIDGITLGGEAELLEIKELEEVSETGIVFGIPQAVKESITIGMNARAVAHAAAVETGTGTELETLRDDSQEETAASDPSKTEVVEDVEEDMAVDFETRDANVVELAPEGDEAAVSAAPVMPDGKTVQPIETRVFASDDPDESKSLGLLGFILIFGIGLGAAYAAFRLFRLIRK
ncbi:MAG: hypothetical protein JEY99_02645, partial [Spirochaetales bacterium]|nr:hypothetical protein [Spirochaetales bacterium]